MHADLELLLRDQDGLVTVADLLAHGVTRSALRWRLDRSWKLCLPGVVQTFTGRLSPSQRLSAAALYAGPDAALTGWAACQLHGLRDDSGDRRLVFLVPRTAGERRFQHVVVRRSLLTDPGIVRRGLVRVSSPGRTVADAARSTTSQDRADALVIEALQRQLVTVEQLTHWLLAGGRRGAATLRRAVDRAASGAWSVPEAELLELLRTSAVLPPVVANPRLVASTGQRLVTPDGWIDDVGLALMVHSRAHHFGAAEWEATIAADSGLAEHGVTVLGFTPRQIRADAGRVLQQVERTYQALRGQGRRARVLPVSPPAEMMPPMVAARWS